MKRNLSNMIGAGTIAIGALSSPANSATVGINGEPINTPYQWEKVSFEDVDGKRFLPKGNILEKDGRKGIIGKDDCIENYAVIGDQDGISGEFTHVANPTNYRGEPVEFKAYSVTMNGGLPVPGSYTQIMDTTQSGLEGKLFEIATNFSDESLQEVGITYCNDPDKKPLDLNAFSYNPDAFNPFEGKWGKVTADEPKESLVTWAFDTIGRNSTGNMIYDNTSDNHTFDNSTGGGNTFYIGGGSSIINNGCKCADEEETIDTAVVPVPAGLPLLITALGGLAWIGRRKQN